VKIKDEDKSNIICCLFASCYKHFKEIILYSNNDTLSFKDVKANLLPKEWVDLEVSFNGKARGFK